MEILRTPADRFDGLPGYAFAPRYADVAAGGDDARQTLRMHYLDEGESDAEETVLLLHGEPSWSYLYRHMIPVITAAGHRAVAPDLVGFGRSDKPADRTDYTYARHIEWLRALLFDELDLHDVTLMGQDWGGLLGLRLVGEHPDRFRRVVIGNSSLPTGDRHPGEAFLRWQRFSQEVEDFAVGFIVSSGCTTDLAPEVVAAYDAPFPDDSFKAGARQFPTLVPTSPDDPAAAANRKAWETLAVFDKPFLCAFSDQDPLTGGADRKLKAEIPGARGQEHTVIEGGGHFLQEDRGPELAAVINHFIAVTPLPGRD